MIAFIKDGVVHLVLNSRRILNWDFFDKLALISLNMSRVVPRELRVTRVEEHHGRWYKWHRVCKNSQLGISMGKATVSLELTVANILKVLTNLRLVVTVQRANDLRPREVSRHGVVEVALFAETVSK